MRAPAAHRSRSSEIRRPIVVTGAGSGGGTAWSPTTPLRDVLADHLAPAR